MKNILIAYSGGLLITFIIARTANFIIEKIFERKKK